MRLTASMGLGLLAIIFTALAAGSIYGLPCEVIGILFIVATWAVARREGRATL